MTLAYFADGSRLEIRAERKSKYWVIPSGPFTRQELDDIRADLSVARDCELEERYEQAEELRRRARVRRDLAYSRVPLLLSQDLLHQMADAVYAEIVLYWVQRVHPRECYGPIESAEWRWERWYGADIEVYRVEWVLVEQGAPGWGNFV